MMFQLSEEQRGAVELEAARLTIIAPPGCGKTEVLAHRVAFLIDILEPGQKTLALTFTNRAKANLMDRLRQTLGVARVRRYVSVQNFHGHATSIILSHGRTLGLDVAKEHLPKSTTLTRALAQLESDFDTRGRASEMLAEAKRAPRSDEEVLAWLRQRGDDRATSLAVQVEESRQASGMLHYEDLLRHAQRILRVDAVAHLYQRHYGALVVDEFQDMSLQQLDLAERSCGTSRTFAGDPGQGIFSWTGAAPTEVAVHLRRQCGLPVQLRESYRSSPRVLDVVGSISELAGHPRLVPAAPLAWAEGGCTARVEFPDRDTEAEAVARLAAKVAEDESSSIGLLSRTGWRSSHVCDALKKQGTPFRQWDLSVDDPATLDRIRRVASGLARGATVGEARAACMAELDPADVDSRELIADAFETLEGAGEETIRGVLRKTRVVDPAQAVGPGVHVLNAHKGKGQQFDWVVVLGLEEKHIPHGKATRAAAIAEELRVLLVMASRARHGLVTTRSLTASGMYGVWRPRASRWWNQVPGQFEELAPVFDHLERVRGGASTTPRRSAGA